MTAEQFAGTQLFESVDIQRLLDDLSKIYRWLLVTDSRHRIVWMSEGLTDFFGADALEIGADARRFVEQLPHPEQVFPLRKDLRKRRFLTATPLDLRTVQGEIVPVQISMLEIHTTEPAAPLLVAIARPASASRDRDAGERDPVFEAAPDAMLAVDAGGFVSRANAAALRMTGRSRGELIGQPAALLFSGNVVDLQRAARSLRGDGAREYRTSI
ncbi:MAG TPA: PAS domain-containing protein, partial [Myxococcota bacterium]|nr:PAS domain-containing protein [Myxococcota bacterium]